MAQWLRGEGADVNQADIVSMLVGWDRGKGRNVGEEKMSKIFIVVYLT